MATNLKQWPAHILSVACSDPASPTSGSPVRFGQAIGVALTDEGEGGNPSTDTSVQFDGVWDLSVKGIDDDGNVAVAVGDALFYVDADTPKLSKKQSGYFAGYALEAITSGSTSTIRVWMGRAWSGGLSNQEFGGVEPADIALPVRNQTGSTIATDKLVYISGWDETTHRFLITLADNDVAGASRAQYVTGASISNNANGTVYLQRRSAAALATNGSTVGDPVYLDATAGGFTLTAPTGRTARSQIVGRVAVVHATTGVVEWDLTPVAAKIGANDIQELAIDSSMINTVAEDAVIGGIPEVYMIAIAAGANAAKNITVTHKIRVIDATVILRGAGVMSAVFTVGNAGNAITDGIAASGSDQALTRAAVINDANYEIAAGGSLRVTASGGATQPAAVVVVTAVKVA